MTDTELVKEVAERVMEWKNTTRQSTYWIDGIAFDPIHDANHRDMVVERMREKGFSGKIDFDSSGYYEVNLWTFKQPAKSGVSYDNSLGRAVLLAAKAALEEE